MNIRNLIAPALLVACGAAVISLAPLAQADATPQAAAPVLAAFTTPTGDHMSTVERLSCPGGGSPDPSGQCDPNRCPSGSSQPAGSPAGAPCSQTAGEPEVRRG